MAKASDSFEENYLASVSDLVIGLLFIFIILLMAFGLNFKESQDKAEDVIEGLEEKRDQVSQERNKIEAERDALRQERENLLKRQEELLVEREKLLALTDRLNEQDVNLQRYTEFFSKRNLARQTMLEEIQSLLGIRNVEVSIVPENGILRLPEELLFESASAPAAAPGGASSCVSCLK